jgi:hypothetical protein
MGKKSSPPPPDYTGAAIAQAQSAQEAQTRADWTNRPNMDTPWGQSKWTASASVDPATGKPITEWSNKVSLSGDQQKSLDDQMAIQSGRSDLAKGMMGRLGEATQKPFDWSNMQELAGVPATGDDTRKRVEQGLFDRMAPQHAQAQAGLEGQLANMGLTRGSEAWNREMQRLGDQQSRERFNALEQGGQEQQRQYGMNMQSAGYQNQLRQQQIAEQAQQRNMPLNELNALLSGQQVNSPGFQNFAQSTSSGGAPLMQAAQAQYGAAQDAYNAKSAQSAGIMSGVGALAGGAMMMMSDIRLKSNVRRIGTHPRGVGIYEYDIFGEHAVGVMAQELQAVAPELVSVSPSGYLMVNYGGL